MYCTQIEFNEELESLTELYRNSEIDWFTYIDLRDQLYDTLIVID